MTTRFSTSIAASQTPAIPRGRIALGMETLGAGASGCWYGNASSRLKRPCPEGSLAIQNWVYE